MLFLDEKKLLDYLFNHDDFSSLCRKEYELPKPYFQDIKKVKAIVLGADPSDIKGNKFEYVFNLEKCNSKYFKMSLSNLHEIGLGLEDIYVQNLCKNYFNVITSRNTKYKKIANYWSHIMKEELDLKFDSDIPVFITAGKVKDALCCDLSKVKKDYKWNYEKAEFIYPNENKLGRILLPLYRTRNNYYSLKKPVWNVYKEKIKELIKETNY